MFGLKSIWDREDEEEEEEEDDVIRDYQKKISLMKIACQVSKAGLVPGKRHSVTSSKQSLFTELLDAAEELDTDYGNQGSGYAQASTWKSKGSGYAQAIVPYNQSKQGQAEAKMVASWTNALESEDDDELAGTMKLFRRKAGLLALAKQWSDDDDDFGSDQLRRLNANSEAFLKFLLSASVGEETPNNSGHANGKRKRG